MTRARAYWDRHAKSYDRSMVLLGGPIPRMTELAADAVQGAEVLEVAAGTGLMTRALARTAKHVVATDYAQAMVERVAARVHDEGLTNVTCEQADIYELRFGEATFDAVVAANVLHLVPDLDGAIAALRRVVKPGGGIIVPTYCHAETLVSRTLSRVLALTGFPGERRLDLEGLRATLERAGVRVERSELLRGVIPIGYVAGTFAQAAG